MSASLRILPLSCACLLLPAGAPHAADWQYSLHAGAVSAPRYSGANERTVAPLLGAGLTTAGGFFLDTGKGLGWAYDGGRFGFSVYANASAARKDRRKGFNGSNKLEGMGSIKSRPLLGIEGTYRFGPLTLGAIVEHAFEQDDSKPDTGSAYDTLKLSLSMPLYKGQLGELQGGVNSQFGNGDYLQTWYGVSDAQAARSQFHAYQAHGGLFSRGADLPWTLPFDERWSLTTVIAADYLTNDAASSPLVERRLQTTLLTQMTYTF
ncbi:MipA/OmpV family protein [Pseudomonas machongensis]